MNEKKSGWLGRVFISTALVVTPVVALESCGLLRQQGWMQETQEEAAKKAREELRHVFADLYDLAFFAPSERNIPLITFDDRKGGDQWGTCVPETRRKNLLICAYNIEMEQMAEASDAARRTARYYRELLADEKGNANIIKSIEAELGQEKVKEGPRISERFEDVYTKALQSGIVSQFVLKPSAHVPHSSGDHPGRGM
ncbi:MAG: hypothetical protein DYH13_10840 [Alphaproteobacteria bacterium PRO2]|nr:hypothetical protein [Alphaproteobacteria bacterium PRO2]